MILGGVPCMVFQCGLCEIKGRELKVWASSEENCKSVCLQDKNCKGIDWGISVDECYLNFDDVKEVGTRHGVGYKAFRKDTCPGDTLSINDYYSLKMNVLMNNSL